MKKLVFALSVLSGCMGLVPEPRSVEALTKEYADALLQSDQAKIDRLLSGKEEWYKVTGAPELKALHAIKVCPQSTQDNSKNVLVLFGGGLKEAVYGLDMSVTRETGDWKVSHVELSRGTDGEPLLFQLNCNLDLTRTALIRNGSIAPSRMNIIIVVEIPEPKDKRPPPTFDGVVSSSR